MIPFDAPSRIARRPNHGAAILVAAIYAVSALVPLRFLNAHDVVVCPFRRLTGLPCPGCGMTHAFLALGHGQPFMAWHYNALSWGLFPLGLAWLARRIAFPNAAASPSKAAAFALWTFVTLALAYDAYRIAVPSARPF